MMRNCSGKLSGGWGITLIKAANNEHYTDTDKTTRWCDTTQKKSVDDERVQGKSNG